MPPGRATMSNSPSSQSFTKQSATNFIFRDISHWVNTAVRDEEMSTFFTFLVCYAQAGKKPGTGGKTNNTKLDGWIKAKNTS